MSSCIIIEKRTYEYTINVIYIVMEGKGVCNIYTTLARRSVGHHSFSCLKYSSFGKSCHVFVDCCRARVRSRDLWIFLEGCFEDLEDAFLFFSFSFFSLFSRINSPHHFVFLLAGGFSHFNGHEHHARGPDPGDQPACMYGIVFS